MYVSPLCVWSLISIIVAHNVTRFPITVSGGTRNVLLSRRGSQLITSQITQQITTETSDGCRKYCQCLSECTITTGRIQNQDQYTESVKIIIKIVAI